MKNITYGGQIFAEQADQTIIIKNPMTTPPIIEWLKQHPLLSLNRLSAAAGIKSTAIYKYMDGTRTMRQEHEKALCEILSNYGYKSTKVEDKEIVWPAEPDYIYSRKNK